MSATEDNGSGKVTYTIREMFAEIKADLRGIDSKLENKAERAVVETLRTELLEVKVQRQSEREMGLQMLAEYRQLQGEHAQLKTDVSVLKNGRRELVIYGGLLINFVGMLAVVYKLFVH